MPVGYVGTISSASAPEIGSSDYASSINQLLTDLKTVLENKIDPDSIIINKNVDFNSNGLNEVKFVKLNNNLTDPEGPSIYIKNNELYYSDGVNIIQLTLNGDIVISFPEEIKGDYSSAEAIISFDDSTNSYLFKDNSDTKSKLVVSDISHDLKTRVINLHSARQVEGVSTGVLSGGVLQGVLLGNTWEWPILFDEGDTLHSITIQVLSVASAAYTFSVINSEGTVLASQQFTPSGGEIGTFVARVLNNTSTVPLPLNILNNTSYVGRITIPNLGDRVKSCTVTYTRS